MMKKDENHCEGILSDVSEAAAAVTDDLLPEHFKADCFDKNSSRKMLKKNSIPYVFDNSIPYSIILSSQETVLSEETLTASAASQETVTASEDDVRESRINEQLKIPLSSIDNLMPTTSYGKRKRRYVGDCDSSDFNSPKKARECWNVAVTQLHKQKLKINRLRKTNVRLVDRVMNHSSLTNHLRQQLLLSENAENIVKVYGHFV
ncbi:hypothetical protein RN001_005694 [Aquatica leii]|uniref:Uncharacterized protein n=1 Tax=Aquatica leii TaxID=1421715 RepID=A0AAN7SS41_9COLE|nr:hypothetical protein RN001_005694 [Aquatica leii]